MARIRARGKPLQTHETEQFLGELGAASPGSAGSCTSGAAFRW